MGRQARHAAFEAARDAYRRLAAAKGGRAEEQELVDVASDPAHPAHDAFTWDDAICGKIHRLEEARRIIRSIRVASTTEPGVQFIAFVRDPVANGPGYVATQVLRQDEAMARMALGDEVRRALGAMHRVRQVALALGLAGEVDHVLDVLMGLSSRVGEATFTTGAETVAAAAPI